MVLKISSSKNNREIIDVRITRIILIIINGTYIFFNLCDKEDEQLLILILVTIYVWSDALEVLIRE